MRRGETVPRAFQAPVDVHTTVDGELYLFTGGPDDSADSSEEELNAVELRPRRRELTRPDRERVEDTILLERNISPGDNLNKLALQYSCKVADIKRVNNLICDQDLFALKSIKIPVKKHSLLTEAITEPIDPQPSGSLPLPQGFTGASTDRLNLKEYTDFLKEVDHDIERLIQTTDTDDGMLSGSTQGLQQRSGRRIWAGYGADWGIQWWNAVLVMLLIGIILPLFYVVYFKTQDGKATRLNNSMVNASPYTSDSTGTAMGIFTLRHNVST